MVQFNIFEAMKHPTKNHSLFGIYLIDELSDPKLTNDTSLCPSPPTELKSFLNHLKYAYLDNG
ncbi:hypothetical protein CR513_44917, partial [Mucuna pruriens]